MQEEGNNIIKGTAEAVQGIIKEIPIYQDLAQPAVQELGQQLVTVAKTVKIALAPISALVWGYETIAEFIHQKVSEKLRNVPNEKIITPAPEIAGPVIESLRFTGHNEKLREMYANLLANAMDSDTVKNAHPSFVEIIKNISADEAYIMNCFIGNNMYPLVDMQGVSEGESSYIVQRKNHSLFKLLAPSIVHKDLIPSYLDNLSRLGLIEIPAMIHISDESEYKPLEEDIELTNDKEALIASNRKIEFEKKLVRATNFGLQFCRAVIVDK